MSARRKKKAKAMKAEPMNVPSHIQDKLNVAIAVVKTVVDALGVEEYLQEYACALMECGLYPLLAIKEEIRKG